MLIVNQYFPPDTSATARVFASIVDELSSRGHQVTVVAGRPSYAPDERLPWRPMQRSRVGGVVVERLGSTAFGRERMLGRVLNYLSFLGLAFLRGLISRRPEAVLVGTDPPLAVVAALVAARGRPVIYSLQDLHPQGAMVGGWVGRGRLAWMWDRIHMAAVRRCARVVCLGARMRSLLEERHIASERLFVVPNGADPPLSLPEGSVVKRLRGGARWVVMHAGNLGVMGAWETLLAASRTWPPQTRLLFVGEGAEAERVAAAGGEVTPYLPGSQLASVMAAGDLQIVTMKKGSAGVVVPSKLYSILVHGRPVLAVVPPDSEVAELVTRTGCGWVADPDKPAAVTAAVESALSDPLKLHAAAEAASEAGEAFLRSRCMARLADIIEGR